MTKSDSASSSPNEDEVKKAAEMREWLEEKIAEVESELVRLKDMQSMVDSILRRTSFVPATELRYYSSSPPSSKAEKSSSAPSSSSSVGSEMQSQVAKGAASQPSEDSARELRRPKDGKLIATAIVSPEKIVITPAGDVRVSQTIPPFQNFFVNRIIKGYESKDQELVSAGKLEAASSIKFGVEETDGAIIRVTIENYRDKARLNEILNTINWAFTKMLEKK